MGRLGNPGAQAYRDRARRLKYEFTKIEMDNHEASHLSPLRQRRMAMLALGGWRFQLETPALVYWIARPPAWGSRFIGPSDTLPATVDRAWIFTLQSEKI